MWQAFEYTNQFLLCNLLYNTTDMHYKRRSNECHERLFMDIVTRVAKPELFVEVGAHEADTSLTLAKKLENCTALALEADPEVFEHFEMEFDRSPPPPNFQYINKAASDHSGVIPFFKQKQKETQSDLYKNNSLMRKPGELYDTTNVECVTLDAISQPELKRPTVLRIDVEGHLFEVLRGATETLKNTIAIYAEVEDYEIWSGQKTVFQNYELLKQAGFSPVTRDVETPGQYNVFFLRNELAFSRAYRGRIALYFKELSVLNELAGRNVKV
ncbi:FkbM family methyltransferase [Pseudovibrio exalbescens]|uniref:FkbM family methyltransferase n=1 Tax=Pseudovibrio exalbescens TaxID=197461 RepID=UPI002366C745|nr:FkbM family methyltransferase [Pseudovibrio exalbescens]MDD7909412.1 FkbM family methyltransferase [Pseudovibrio exalbescens]